jgi:hypothetical protein
MGSDETATATTGGPRVIDVFDGTGAPSGPNCTLFSGVDRLSDALRDRSGVGLSPTLHTPVLGALQRALDPKLWHFVLETSGLRCILADVSTDGSARACGVGDCPRLGPTPNDFRETSGPRIDRIPPTHPPWWRRQFRELKKLIFSAPDKCPIDLFGPVANGTILKRPHGVRLLVSYMPLARTPWQKPGVRV